MSSQTLRPLYLASVSLLPACLFSPEIPPGMADESSSAPSAPEETMNPVTLPLTTTASETPTSDVPTWGSEGFTSEFATSQDAETSADSTTNPNDVPKEPELHLSFSPIKQFNFTWMTPSGAESFNLLEEVKQGEGWEPLAEGISGNALLVTMPLHRRFGSRYVLQACNTHGCTDSEPVEITDSMAEAVGYFKASNGGEADKFGSVVALSADGNTLAVGAPFEDSKKTDDDVDSQADNSAEDAGAVYIFVRDEQSSEWVQQAYVKASNPDPYDYFGSRVALSEDGSMLVVGAYGEDSKSPGIGGDQLDNSSPEAGAVYVFIRQSPQQGVQEWTQEAYIKASNPDPGDLFGARLALAANGTRLVVSAYAESSSAWGTNGGPTEQADNLASHAGAAYVFDRDAELKTWTQASYLKADNTDPGDEFGKSISISADGGVLVVGASHEDGQNNDMPDAGAVYIFKPGQGSSWGFSRRFTSSNTQAGDTFGTGLALSGDGVTLAVSAPYESGLGHQSGAIHVFVYENPYWNEEGYLKPFVVENSMNFGGPVISFDGSLIVGRTTNERSKAVGVGGDTLDFSLNSAGAVYTFERSGETWLHGAYVKAPNTDSKDRFGGATALSADGNTLAIGAEYEDSAAKEIGGEQNDEFCQDAGAAYLY